MKDIAASVLARLKNQAKETIKLIHENNKVTKQQIAKAASVGEKTVERQMKKMSSIKFVGRGYSGYWEINEVDIL